ncbi:MAG TPA: multidrug effflux MFS transporter [Alphaproteobacteria bacterium]|nr:multidrug effflux MFS transporter [Alphaproteobacteria bacterium]
MNTVPKPAHSNVALLPQLVVFVSVGLIGVAMYTPSLPAIAKAFGTQVVVVQFTMTVYLIGFAAAQLVVGALSDRFGRKPILVAGYALFVLASVACALADDINLLIVARFFQALGASVGVVVARAIVRDRTGVRESARYMAYIGMAAGLTPMLSPMVGGVVQVGFGWRGVFFAMVALGVAAFATALFVLRESHPPENRIGTGMRELGRGYLGLMRERAFVAYAMTGGMVTAAFFIFLAAGPVVMIGEAGLRPDQYGFIALCMPGGYITGNFVASRILPRIGIHRGIVAGNIVAVLGASGFVLIGLTGHFSIAAFVAPLAVIGFGNGITVPATFAGAVGANPKLAGTASGLTGFLQIAFSALVNPLAGLARHGSLFELAAMLFALCFAGLLVYHLLLPRAAPISSAPKTL